MNVFGVFESEMNKPLYLYRDHMLSVDSIDTGKGTEYYGWLTGNDLSDDPGERAFMRGILSDYDYKEFIKKVNMMPSVTGQSFSHFFDNMLYNVTPEKILSL